ncbi:MAG: type II secretion system F family protein [Lachnospiraceae bacterium]|nr:type II secretion system F family protein [Lachnospiraceae bacterium]
MYDEFELSEMPQGQRLSPESFMEQGFNVPLPIPMPEDNLGDVFDADESLTADEGSRNSSDDSLTFLEPSDIVIEKPAREPEYGRRKRKRPARKAKGRSRGKRDEADLEAPSGDWSEFASARVSDKEAKETAARVIAQKDDREGEDKRYGLNITDAYTVTEKGEYEKIDISRAEARGTIPYDDMRDLCAQFARIHEAGVSVIDTVRILIEQTPNDELREALEKIYNDLKDGYDLSVAMGNCACFPFALTIAVSSAEKNDMVALVFKRFADIFDREVKQRRMTRGSVFYPALVTACSLVVMIVMMLVVYPGFVDMFTGMDNELPGLSRALLALADSFRGIWWLLMILTALVLAGIFIYRKASSADILGPKLGEKSLPAGSYKRMNVYAKFARYMNALLEVGVATKDALFVTAHSFTEYPFLTYRLLDAANASAAGSTLSNALCVFDFFPIMVLQMISVGEEMGDTPQMLMHVAEYYEEEAKKDAEKRLARREPVSIVVMAVIVLFLLMSMLQPVLRFYDLVKGL